MDGPLFGDAGRFSTLLLDPPWEERGGGQVKRGADRHYPLLPTKKMPGVIRRSGVFDPAADAHMYLWVTNNFLPDGLWLMARLGFRYVTNLVWVKRHQGVGQYFRGQHELLLFGVRGDGAGQRSERRDLGTVLQVDAYQPFPPARHSAKPAVQYDLIEARSPGAYVELFARHERPGWTSWGPTEGIEAA